MAWLALAVSVSASVTLIGCKGMGTHLVVPTPPSSRYVALDVHAIHALSPTDLWLAGDLTTTSGTHEGLILWTTDGGKNWRRAGSEIHDLGSTSFTAVYFTDRVRGWIGGKRITPEGVQRGVIFRTGDGGNHWTEMSLSASDDVVIEDLHSMSFKSDTEGEVVVAYRDRKSSEVTESVYQTLDGGRVWAVTSFAQAPKAKATDRTVSYYNTAKTNGYRVRRSDRPGVTVLETTASAGKDWMVVSELSISYIPSFY
jgi:photosystem II stability/assembly factor-like uncharacterized protein